MKALHVLVLIAALLLTVGIAQGQNDDDACPVVVQTALDLTGDVCGATGRNEICYGNVVLEAEPQEWADSLALDGPGDIEDVAAIRRVQLSSMDTVTSEWGIALMRLQANLPDTLPGQNVLFVLFGNVEIESAVVSNAEPLIEIVRVTSGVNLRQGPSTNTTVIGGLAAGDEVTVDGVSEDGLWLRVRLDEGYAWVFAELVTTDGDLDMLDVVQATDETASARTPMQAFYLQTGLSDSTCTEAPDSGVLVQSPTDVEMVTFRVNEVDIGLGSTVYLQAGDELRVVVIEGQAEVTSFDVMRVVPAGAQVFVQLDANGLASGPPGLIEAYTAEDMAALPVPLLDEAIEIAEPLRAFELVQYTSCLVTASEAVELRAGPGDDYRVEREMLPGSMLVDGQAQNSDGTVWWLLSTDVWVSSSVVEESGPCDTIPVMEVPPVSVREPQPEADVWRQRYFEISPDCESLNSLAVGRRITFQHGIGRWPTRGEKEAALSGVVAIMTLDGAPLTVYYEGTTWHVGGEEAGYGERARADWTVTPGDHTIVSTWSNGWDTATCAFTVSN